MTLGVFPVSSQFPCKSWREKVYIHLTSDLISSDETIHINTTRSLGNTVWQTVSRPKSHWARHQLLFFSLLHYQIKCETDKGIIWTLARRLQVDRRRLILAVLNKMNHFIFFFFFPGDSRVGCGNRPRVSGVTFSSQPFSWCASSEHLTVSAAIK